MTDLEKEIIGWLRALPSDGDRAMLRKQVLDFFLSRTSGTGIARPPEPAEQQE